MSPAIQQAFDAFFKTRYLANGIGRQYALDTFEAGYNAGQAASAQTEAVLPLIGSTVSAEDIYAAYPRKVGKQGAIKIIKRLTFNNISAAWLLARTQAYAKAIESWPEEDGKYIPHPATWFNRGSYDDDPKEWERNTAPASQFSVSH